MLPFFNDLSRYKKHQATKAFVWFEEPLKMKKVYLIIFILLFNFCSASSDDGVASLSNDTTTTSVIAEEDYPIVLTQCLNEEMAYNIATPFDIEDLKSTIDQMTSRNKGKEERSSIMKDVEECIQDNELWPDRQSENPEEMARRFDSNLKLAQCLREKGLDIADPTQDNAKLNLSEVGGKREDIKEYIQECQEENDTFEKAP